jgi:hypothetical protein
MEEYNTYIKDNGIIGNKVEIYKNSTTYLSKQKL